MSGLLAYEGMTPLDDSGIAEMLGYRESYELPNTGEGLESTALDKPWQEVIPRVAYDFVVRWETGGRAYYEQVIKGRPIWPAYSSGITIGCGYDLGYHTLAEFQADWGTRIPRAEFDRLEPTIGFKTTDPNRAAKVRKAQALVESLQDIVVRWDVAIEQFDTAKMPKLVGDLYRALDNLDRLNPLYRGPLLSLVFNRGAGGFTSSKDRYREMREIRRLMTAGRRTDFEKIPAQLRAMIRIWGEDSSLAKRRREEAELFERGLAEFQLTESLQLFVQAVGIESAGEPLTEIHEDVAEPSDVDEDAETVELGLEAAGPTLADVKWNPNDDEQPDYRHLPKLPSGTAFDLTAADLEALVEFNAFATVPGPLLVFALRGAAIAGAEKRENVESIAIIDQRPNHRDYRCVIGVLNRETQRLSAYRASTVPNANGVLSGYIKAQRGEFEGNVLPTGCYIYTVGTHRAGTSGEIRGVLRLSKTMDGASVVIALRSTNDVVYDRRDFWHQCAPADNIHPGRRNQGFSSLGCLTLPGDYEMTSKTHTGLWADFRVALGMRKTFATSDNGKQFSMILVTGQDAALAASLRSSGEISNKDAVREALLRLRFGSKGAAVAKLQEKLGLEPDNTQLLGPVTRAALIGRQQQVLGWADGIYSSEMDDALGFGLLR
ncbi:Hypothetical protein NGAL_HAMBI2605_64450 [Neorhizobium galegae bv. orientalis]|nr:Hypothetical protein NGAL_HAMBI2605_64450 [Neorhizobium galegae bv. orientalis]